MKKAIFFIILLLSSFFYVLMRNKKESPQEKDVFKFGEVVANKKERHISFKADIQKNEGNVLFLIYLHGYKWLKENSAVVSDAKLLDMQKAIAFVDWELWDELWNSKKTKRTGGIKVALKQGEIISDARDLLKNDGSDIYDIIFTGTPYFDASVLYSPDSPPCTSCPLYPIEKEAIMKMIKNPKGLTLSEKIKAFDKNKPVTIYIYVPE